MARSATRRLSTMSRCCTDAAAQPVALLGAGRARAPSWPAFLLVASVGWGSLLTTLEYWPGWTSWRWWALFLRHPDLWWFCRRLELHYLFGFPKPALPSERLEA